MNTAATFTTAATTTPALIQRPLTDESSRRPVWHAPVITRIDMRRTMSSTYLQDNESFFDQ